jgi:hypothetical protein
MVTALIVLIRTQHKRPAFNRKFWLPFTQNVRKIIIQPSVPLNHAFLRYAESF